MKKIVYSLLISSFATLFVGCDYQEQNDDKFGADPSAGYVAFSISDNGTPDNEDDDFSYAGMTFNTNVGCGTVEPIRVPITLHAPVNKNGLDINYTITDIVGTSAGNVTVTANIPEDQLEGELFITAPEELSSSISFKLTLTSTENSAVTIGSPNSTIEESVIININRAERDRFQGNYTITGVADTGYPASISSGDAPNELVITNLFNLLDFTDSQTTIFLNEDGTVSFPAAIDNYLGDDVNVGPLYVEGVSGSYGGSCEGELTVTFRLRFGNNLSGSAGPFTAVFNR